MSNDDQRTPLVDAQIFLDAHNRLQAKGHNEMGKTLFVEASHRDLGDGLVEVYFALRWVMRGAIVDGTLVCEPPPGPPLEPEEP